MVTTWTNAKISRKEVHSDRQMITYYIDGISGDVGGTLTTKMTHIENAFVSAFQAAGMVAALQWRISANTVVVTYTDPTATHEVRITVMGA